ncbi:unnamed protein product, partial [Nesidiocoris tenuis]
MSSKENNSEVAVEKATENNDKPNNDAKAEVKGTKRPAEFIGFISKASLHTLHFVHFQDKTEDVKKSKKEEENGEGDNFEEILDEEEEELEGEEDEEDNLSEADEMGDDLGEGEVTSNDNRLKSSVIPSSKIREILFTKVEEKIQWATGGSPALRQDTEMDISTISHALAEKRQHPLWRKVQP